MPRHAALVRVTHWITFLAFAALLVTGAEIVVSHPRFYWGESGNVLTQPLFKIPIPSSRRLVPTGYDYVTTDQNGWSRALHFQSAWLLVAAGCLYFAYGIASGHFRKSLFSGSWSPRAIGQVLVRHLRFERAGPEEAWSYNPLQKLAYAAVIFVLFPLVVWTGLAMSPAFDSAFPATVTTLGGQQSARTIHFLVSIALLLFLLVHVAMICISGFRSRMRAMITGRPAATEKS